MSDPQVRSERAETSSLPVLDDPALDQTLSQFAWAIAHPARMRILRILLERKACVCGQLVEMMPLAQSTVSQHLKILKESGLVQGEIEGPKVCYCVNRGNLQRFKDLIAAL